MIEPSTLRRASACGPRRDFLNQSDAGSGCMTHEEAQGLIQVLKQIMRKGVFNLPQSGERKKLELRSVFSDKDRFFVLFNRYSRIQKEKYTLLLRYGKDQCLIRIDVNGPAHSNPDGTCIPCPHIHIQQQNFGKWDAWAFELPALFDNAEDRVQTFKDFLEYCNANNISSIMIQEQEELG